jgi:flagellar assembly protein FliH
MEEPWNAGSVLPLEFKAVDHPLRRKSDWNLEVAEEYDAETEKLREQVAELELRLVAQQQQTIAQVAEGRRLAKLEARHEWASELYAQVQKERAAVELACAEFAKDRARYFAAVEGEVVRLALAIAERVLHREAKLDPLLLGAAVRVALEKLAEGSASVLHVPAAKVDEWRAMLSEESRASVTVVGEERMDATECVLETNVGRVELGVAVQLAEIEKGFFDLLQQRPG